jgi:hypothetical protein
LKERINVTKREFLLNSENISQERLDGEVIIISFDSGKYFSAKNSGADVLWLIEKGISRSAWELNLSAEFRNFSSVGIDAFLDSLVHEKLIVEGEGLIENRATLPNDYSRGDWEPPVLVAFNDLEDLLLIDPIHDTSTEGWPNLKNE